MTEPDPKTVREIARKFLTEPDISADELDYVVRSYIGYVGGEEHTAWRDAVRADADDAVVVTTATWPDEQQLAETTGVRGRVAVDAAVEQLREAAKTREGTGLEGLDAPVLVVLAELERLRRHAEATGGEQVQDGAAGRVEAWVNRIAAHASDETDTRRIADFRAVLAERNALAARVAELEGEREADSRAVAALTEAAVALNLGARLQPALGDLDDRFVDRIAALDDGADGGAE